jgi:hypothetical protein
MSILTQIVEILENSGISYEISKNSTGISVNFSESLVVVAETTETSTAASDYPSKPDGEGWISNIGNAAYRWPDGCGVEGTTLIVVEKRNGVISTGLAEEWDISWQEVNRLASSIIRFRIIK